RGRQTACFLPGKTVENSRNRGHDEIFVIWNRRAIVQVRCPEDNRCKHKTHNPTAGDTLEPILNKPPKKQPLRNHGEEKASKKSGRRRHQLGKCKAVMDEMNGQSEWNGNRGK